ncbi:hypothetical protein BDR22DRAFT_374280 [Usnea florida]
MALAVFFVLAVIAAGIAGSLAARRGDASQPIPIMLIPTSLQSLESLLQGYMRFSPHVSIMSMTRPSNLLPTVPLSAQNTPRASPVQASSSNAVSIYMATIWTVSSCIISPIVWKHARPSPIGPT